MTMPIGCVWDANHGPSHTGVGHQPQTPRVAVASHEVEMLGRTSSAQHGIQAVRIMRVHACCVYLCAVVVYVCVCACVCVCVCARMRARSCACMALGCINAIPGITVFCYVWEPRVSPSMCGAWPAELEHLLHPLLHPAIHGPILTAI